MFSRRLSPSKFIVSVILVLALLLLLFIGHSAWQAWQARNDAGYRVLGSRISTLAVQLATSRAMERGLSMARLSTRQRTERDLQHKLREVRLDGDAVREDLIEVVQEWLDKHPRDFVFEVELAQEKKHQLALNRLRERLDLSLDERLQPLEPMEVFDVLTQAIGHAEHLNMTAKTLTVAEAGAKSNEWAIREWASYTSEQAGQMRGLLAYYIGTREPIPPQIRYQIQSARYEVEHYIELLLQLEPRLEDAVELRKRIRELDKAIPTESLQMHQTILAAAESGNYPVDQEIWLAAANRAVAGLVAVATAGANSMEAAATAQQRTATQALAWLLISGVLAMGLAGLAFYRVRDTARTLETQRNRAEQAVGELSDEIAARRQLEMRLRRYQTIISTSPDHFALIDPDYTYSIVNETYLRAHDRLPEQIAGKTVAELLGEEVFQGQVRQNLDRCLTNETVNYEAWFDFPGSGRRFMNVTYFPFHDEAGAVAGVVVSSRDVTELKHAEEALHQREEQLRTITNAIPGLVMQVDRDYHSSFVNQTGAEWFGSPMESIPESPLCELVGDERFTAIHPYFEQAFAGERITFEAEFPCADGITRWLQLTLVPGDGQGVDGQVLYVLGNDITYRKKMENKLQASQASFRSLVEQNLTGIIVVDHEWNSLFCNSAGGTMLGESAGSEQCRCHLPEGLRESDAELDIWRLDGTRGVAQALVTETVWQGTPAQLIMLYDITERKQAEREIAHMAYHDVLTGLPNRVMFQDRIEHALARGRRSNTKLALLYLDLDRFKMINDSLGHASGDELLRQIAQRLRKSVREMDTVARLSGDEFMVLLEDLDKGEQARNVAEKIRLALGSPYQIHNQQLVINGSIGISVFPTDGEDAEILIRHADTAMYHAKHAGRNRVQTYRAEMGERFTERMRLEQSLHRALEHNEFRLHYQPQVDVYSGKIVGAEALLRWQHPERGLVAPAEFIPVLEDSGLIEPVGEWVLHEACQQAIAWRELGLPPLTMSVNLSGRQFENGDLAGYVAQLLGTIGLEPHNLELEITETVLMETRTDAPAVLRALKQLGVKVAVDDFGTGYSSLSYLKQFDIDRLKIDRSFIRDVPNDADDIAIIRAVLAMAKALHLEVTAEGVETQGQHAFLRKYHCRTLQGYLFSRPVEANQFVVLHQARKEGQDWVV